jgi:hypothetical protein
MFINIQSKKDIPYLSDIKIIKNYILITIIALPAASDRKNVDLF